MDVFISTKLTGASYTQDRRSGRSFSQFQLQMRQKSEAFK